MITDEEKIRLLVQWMFKTGFLLKNEIIEFENAHQFSAYPQDALELFKRKVTLNAFNRFEHDINIILFGRW